MAIRCSGGSTNPRVRPWAFMALLAALAGVAGSAAAQQGDRPGGRGGDPEGGGCGIGASDLYFVDAHSQMDHRVDEARVISLMDHGGVYRTLLSHHLNRPWSSIVAFAAQQADRITPMVRTKGESRGGRESAYRQNLMEQVQSGRHRGIAEVLVWHAGDPDKNVQEARRELDSMWVTTALEIARAQSWPLIVHIEFASLSGDARAAYMRALEALARKLPTQPIVLIHMGQLDAVETGRLLAAHSNLYFMTSHSNPVAIDTIRSKTWENLFQGNAIAPQWQRLMMEKPDRFVFALDNVFASFWMPGRYLRQMSLWWCGLGRLPAAAAHAIAHGNAERLWKLPAKPAHVRALPPWQARQQLGPVLGTAEGGGRDTDQRPRGGGGRGQGGGHKVQ